MDQKGMVSVAFEGDGAQAMPEVSLPQAELRHFRNVTGSVAQDALKVWADVWGELENGIVFSAAMSPEAKKGFRPSCGWPEFLEKMWLLRHYVDFLARFSRR